MKELIFEPSLDSHCICEPNETKTKAKQLLHGLQELKQLFLPPYLGKIALIVSIQFMIMMR